MSRQQDEAGSVQGDLPPDVPVRFGDDDNVEKGDEQPDSTPLGVVPFMSELHDAPPSSDIPHTSMSARSKPSSSASTVARPLDASENARELVRLVQCSQCAKPLQDPMTLPCGNTLCKTCVPELHLRTNISYPATANRLQGFTCPFTDCGQEHAAGDCSLDVTLAKVMEVVRADIEAYRAVANETSIMLEERDRWMVAGVASLSGEQARTRVLQGGRLVATYTMTEMGELAYDSEIAYTTMSGALVDHHYRDAGLLEHLKQAARSELDCQVCYALFLEPFTTTCGHTFCRKCLHRVLDHSNCCPICRRSLAVTPSLTAGQHPSNKRLHSLLSSLCPDSLNARLEAIRQEELDLMDLSTDEIAAAISHRAIVRVVMAANTKSAVDFDEIIQADRQRRKNEALAKQIFGKGRRASTPGAGVGNRKPGTGPSLASRVGITKRSLSTAVHASAGSAGGRPNQTSKLPPNGNVNADWTHDLHDSTNAADSRASQLPYRRKAAGTARDIRLYSALTGSISSPAAKSQINIVGGSKPSKGISIRGLAGPCSVRAQNFAPGTTAADIESAMGPVGGNILKCFIITARPTVIAEIIFETKEGAEAVIETFNNQTADGRLLHLYLKPGPVNLPSDVPAIQPEPPASKPRATTPLGPRAELPSDRSSTRYAASDRYEPREQRRDYDREDRNDIVDGSYGFDDRMDTDDQDDNYSNAGRGRGLYSDNIVSGRGDRGGIRSDRELGRGRGDGRDRGRRGVRSRGYR